MAKDELDYTEEELNALSEREPTEDDDLVDEPKEDDPDIIEGDDEEDPEDEEEVEAEEAETEEPQTYSKAEYDKVVRQRDAIAHEKQTAGKDYRERLDRVDTRLAAIMEAMEESGEEEEEVDLTDMNTAERIEHQNKQILERLDKIEEHDVADDDVKAARSATKQIQGFAIAAEEAYLEETEDIDKETFDARLNAVRGDLYEDYIDDGDDDAVARGKVANFEMNLITQAHKSGKNPAAIMMRRFKRKRLQVAQADPDEVEKPKKKKRSPVRENLKRIQSGRKASAPSSKRSGGTSMKLTAEALDDMEPEEFEAVMAKIKGTTKEDQLDTHGYTYLNV